MTELKQKLISTFAIITFLLGTCLLVSPAWAEDHGRKARDKVAPVYPEAAHRLDITGAVRLQVTVGTDGRVTQVKLLGGHPLLAQAAISAVKQWRYEPGPESVETVLVQFSH